MIASQQKGNGHLVGGGRFFTIFAAMKLRIHIGVFFLLAVSTSWAQARFHPGDVIPKPYLKVFGYEQFFSISMVPEPVRGMMYCCSFKSDVGVSWEDLRYLQVLHCDVDGNSIVGEMVCAATIAKDVLDIMKQLYVAAYPIEKMRLVDYYGGDDEASMRDNNTSCFNQRSITAGGRISKHSYGLAIDINPRYNPYYKVRGKAIIRPEGSEEFLDRKIVTPYTIRKGDLCYRLFKKHGFYWGGDWLGSKDYQHFEK